MEELNVIYEEVPVTKVVVVNGTYPRAGINRERVEIFKEIYENGKNALPPIEVVAILSEDRKNVTYALLDGLHRLEARKECNAGTIAANLYPEMTISESELDTLQTKCLILDYAAKFNWLHGQPFTLKERRSVVQTLFRYGKSIKDLSAYASEKTLRKWLREQLKEKDREKDEKKKEGLKLLQAGQPKRRVARELSVPLSTLRDWARKEKTGNNGNKQPCSMKGGAERGNLPVSAPPGEGFFSETTNQKGCESLKGPQKQLDEVYETLRTLKYTEETEHDLKFYIIPLLRKKSSVVEELIKDGGYAIQLEREKEENKRLKEELFKRSQHFFVMQTRIEELQEHLRVRKEFCSEHCPHTRAKMKVEFDRSLMSLLEDITKHIEAFPLIAAENKVSVYKNLTLTLVYKFLSSVDWGFHQGVLTETSKDIFDRFKDVVADTSIYCTDIRNRIKKLESSITKPARLKLENKRLLSMHG